MFHICKDNKKIPHFTKIRENFNGANHKSNQQFKWCKKAGHQKLKKQKYCMIAYYIIIHSDSLGLLAIWNKEGISMEYLDIKGQKSL